jgi:hypothetical protein
MKYVNFCLTALSVLLLSAGSVKNDISNTGYYPGEIIPDITITDLAGDVHRLHEFKGKKVVVNFWAAYDAPSRANNVRLHHYLSRYHPDIAFLSIAFDENINVVERTLALDNLDPASQFCEVNGPDSKLYKDFKLNRGFRNYLIDEDGKITAMNITPDELDSIL